MARRDERVATADDLVRELFAQHYLALVRLAMRLVDDQDSAEDLVQDVFAALRPDRLARLDDPRRYLQTAVVNRSRSALRRRRVARVFALRQRPDEVGEGADAASLREADRQRMLAAIRRLPQRQREAVVLRYYEDLPVADVATVLSATPGAVSAALARAMTALATVFEGDRRAD